MVAVLVSDDVLSGEVTGGAELLLQLLQELEVEVDEPVGRAVERPDLRGRLTARRVDDAGEELGERLLVLAPAERLRVDARSSRSATSSVAPQMICSISVSHCVGPRLACLAATDTRCGDRLAATTEKPREEDRRGQHEQPEQPAAGLHGEAHPPPPSPGMLNPPPPPCPRRSRTRLVLLLRIRVTASM